MIEGYWEQAVLKAIQDSGGAWTGVKNARTGQNSFLAFLWLWHEGYIDGMGTEVDTAVWHLTQKGREAIKNDPE